jgi:hypothetical protein
VRTFVVRILTAAAPGAAAAAGRAA